MHVSCSSTTTTMAASSSKPRSLANVHRAQARKVLLSDGLKIDMTDEGLHAIKGAQQIIQKIKERKAVTKLILGHNSLGSDGCEELFRFLCSEEGHRYKLSEISINSNGIGDRGLEAISEYLVGNQNIRELKLQNNAFQGNPEVAYRFALAISSSRLDSLSIVANHSLSDAFLSIFLSVLDSPYLRDLQISSIDLTTASTPTLVSYLTSPRCRALEKLACNSNWLGVRCTRTILRALKRNNFTLYELSMRPEKGKVPADLKTPTAAGSETEDSEDEENLNFNRNIAEIRQEIELMTDRNKLLKKLVGEEAIALLPYARTLLLHSSTQQHPHLDPNAQRIEFENIAPPTNYHTDLPNGPPFPFVTLPTELQHYILSFLAPSLSPAQLLRVLKFASAIDTLPPLFPKLRNKSGCIPDPTTLLTFAPISTKSNYCSSGKCMGAGGSVFCHRYDERNRWLEQVGCNHFDPDGRTEEDVLRLLQRAA